MQNCLLSQRKCHTLPPAGDSVNCFCPMENFNWSWVFFIWNMNAIYWIYKFEAYVHILVFSKLLIMYWMYGKCVHCGVAAINFNPMSYLKKLILTSFVPPSGHHWEVHNHFYQTWNLEENNWLIHYMPSSHIIKFSILSKHTDRFKVLGSTKMIPKQN